MIESLHFGSCRWANHPPAPATEVSWIPGTRPGMTFSKWDRIESKNRERNGGSRRGVCESPVCRRAEAADSPLSLDAETVRRLELPASADVLGVCTRSHRREWSVAGILAHDFTPEPLPSLRHRRRRSRAGHSKRTPPPRAMAVWSLDRAAHEAALDGREKDVLWTRKLESPLPQRSADRLRRGSLPA